MIKLNINGINQKIDAPSNMPLLWVLRDILQLTGTKYGCGIGQCGACTVHLNGQAIRSCTTQIGDLDGQKITTIEGLSPNKNSLHPIQQSWIDHDVPQCGYCQSGQIMQAVAFLKQYPTPNDEQITQAMEGNLCRCGTYIRIRAAIKSASELNS